MTARLNYSHIAPAGMRAFHSVHSYIAECSLPKTLINLVYLRVSQINGCAYCIDMHSHDLLKDNISIEKLVLIPVWHEGGNLFSKQEQAALSWAETVTRVIDTNIPDQAYQEVLLQFSEKELVDLTMAISLMNALNRLSISFRTPPDSTKP